MAFAILFQQIEAEQCLNYENYWPCKCRYLTGSSTKIVLNCRHDDIQKIYDVFDNVIPPNSTYVEEISIYSKIDYLRPRLVGNAIPRKIWISVQGLVFVDKYLLRGLENRLDLLSIDKTELDHVPARIIKWLKKIQTFEFRNSKKVVFLNNNAFTGFAGYNTIERIILAHNNIHWLGKGAFTDLPRLKEVDLEGNKLETISLNSFPPTIKKMKYLFLG